jgi:hypothetical protein
MNESPPDDESRPGQGGHRDLIVTSIVTAADESTDWTRANWLLVCQFIDDAHADHRRADLVVTADIVAAARPILRTLPNTELSSGTSSRTTRAGHSCVATPLPRTVAVR